VATTSANVRVAVTGKVSVAPTATAAPTTSSSTLNVAFVELGYVGDGGVTEIRERSTTDVKAWQNNDVVRTIVTDGKMTYKFTLLETSKPVLEAFYGATTTGGTVTDGRLDVIATATGGRKSFVIDVTDLTELHRIYLASAEITEVGDVVYSGTEPIGREVTVTSYPVGGFSAQIWSTALKN